MITISIPVLFFIILEYSLRLFNYGRDPSLFIVNPDAPEYLLPRPDVVKRYFPKTAPAPEVTIETNFFKKIKPENGIRIFVQGGSTAAGFPFGYGASIAGMLDYRLKQSFPDRPVEVVNTALSAVNSFTLLDFSDEIIAQNPDAILIYAGHNEYLGILGIGSAYTTANSYVATDLFLKLRHFRTFQLFQNLFSHTPHFQKSFDKKNAFKNEHSRTFMSKVAKQKNIKYGSDIYEQGLKQFSNNMNRLIEKYQRAGIPVFISTIASNIKDLPPFSSQKLPENILTANKESILALNSQAINTKQIQQLESISSRYKIADLDYKLGQYFYKHKNFISSKKHFIAARDEDLLRFRAPSAINQIIRKLAKKKNVNLVDSNFALEQQSPNGIIGNNVMLEHLHPNIKGYFIIADSFYRALEKSHILGNFQNSVSTQQASQEIPVFPAEIYWGKAKIASLKADFPFSSSPVKPQFPAMKTWSDFMGYAAFSKKSSWLDIAIKTLQRSKNDPKHLTMAAKLLADALPQRADYSFQAGVFLIRNHHPEEALRYLKRATHIEPENINYRLALSHAYILQGRYKEALPWLNSVLKIDPNNKTALSARDKINSFMAK